MDQAEMLKIMYNNVLSQALSESGKFIFAGNRFGDIFVQNIEELDNATLVNPQTKATTEGYYVPISQRNAGIFVKNLEDPRPKVKLYPQGDMGNDINSLAFHRDYLIVGSIGVLYGLKWNEDLCKLSSTRSWEIKIPLAPDAMEVPDVNSLWLDELTDQLYAGCGDNNVYQISLEEGRIVRQFVGHSDYVHSVTGSHSQIFSASEDGTVRLWCAKQKESTATLEPCTQTQLARPEYGSWIGSVAVNSDWLVCGGGPKLSIWHLRSLECIRDFPFPGKVHCCDFIDDSIVVAGEHNTAQLYTMSGDALANIPLEHTATYSIVWQHKPYKFMSIAGYSNKLHFLNDFRFLDCKISLYGNVE